MKESTKIILRYAFLPQLAPRIKGLFFSGFSHVAFFMAQIYRTVRLLPDSHPYLSAENIGRFGIRHVIAEAGLNLSFKKENIDQVAVFLMMLFGMILMTAQLFMLLIAGFVDVAYAGAGHLIWPSSSPLLFFTYFEIPDATHELAFIILDRVFGIPHPAVASPGTATSIFQDAGGGYSCVVTGGTCHTGLTNSTSSRVFTPDGTYYTKAKVVGGGLVGDAPVTVTFPWPYHEALRGMLQVYSVGLSVIGVMIFSYFIFALAAETAQSGTPFGRRFEKIWAPIRIVLAMGLLVPITHGLNAGQWVLVHAAKWGSNFATNGWVIYNNAISGEDTPLGPRNTVVAVPTTPPVNTLMEFGSVLATCKEAYERVIHQRNGRQLVDIDAWLVNPYVVGLAPVQLTATNFDQALDYFDYGTIYVRFGELRPSDDAHQSWDGEVAPLCGEISMEITYAPNAATMAGMTEPGSYEMLFIYYTLIRGLWNDVNTGGGLAACCFTTVTPTTNFNIIGEQIVDRHVAIDNNSANLLPTPQDLTTLRDGYQAYIDDWAAVAAADQATSTEWDERLTELGWAGAAIWYNKVAQLNGGLVSAVYSMPTVKKWPLIMEELKAERASADSTVSGENEHQPYRGTDDQAPFEDEHSRQIANAMYIARTIWRDNSSELNRNTNAVVDAINAIFGTEGLYNITANETQNIHPLAQLATIGRTIVDSAIRNLGYSAAAGLGGGLSNLFQQHEIGTFASTSSSFFFQVAMIGLSIGFVLFYIIPFLPFIYFFFAVGGWVKGIFEAMVGVPLWALAHIRIDGKTLPGDAAMGGYYLILEIFLRPILTIFGFIASIMIFTAQVQILHEVWPLVVSNAAGFQQSTATAPADVGGSIRFMRSAVDEFFFSIIYAITCYILAMTSFKLIDQVPNHILRWMGSSMSTFGDQAQDPAQNLVRNSYLGAGMVSRDMQQAVGGFTGAARASGQAASEPFSRTGG